MDLMNYCNYPHIAHTHTRSNWNSAKPESIDITVAGNILHTGEGVSLCCFFCSKRCDHGEHILTISYPYLWLWLRSVSDISVLLE